MKERGIEKEKTMKWITMEKDGKNTELRNEMRMLRETKA